MREQLVQTQMTQRRLADIERILLSHDTSLKDLYERIKPLLLPPSEAPKRRIGFRAEENRR